MNEIKISIKSNEIEQENIVLLRNKINEINCSFNLSEILNFRKTNNTKIKYNGEEVSAKALSCFKSKRYFIFKQ